MTGIKFMLINFIATEEKTCLSTWAFFLESLNYEAFNSPVLRMRVNGSLLVFPFIVYRLTEYVVPGCKSWGDKNENKTRVKTGRIANTSRSEERNRWATYLWEYKCSHLLEWFCSQWRVSHRWAWPGWSGQWWNRSWSARSVWRTCLSPQRCAHAEEDLYLHRGGKKTLIKQSNGGA